MSLETLLRGCGAPPVYKAGQWIYTGRALTLADGRAIRVGQGCHVESISDDNRTGAVSCSTWWDPITKGIVSVHADAEPDRMAWVDFVHPHSSPLTARAITESAFWNALEALPPAAMRNGGFLLGECAMGRRCRITGDVRDAFHAFWKLHDRHYEGSIPLTKPEFAAITPAILRALVDGCDIKKEG